MTRHVWLWMRRIAPLTFVLPILGCDGNAPLVPNGIATITYAEIGECTLVTPTSTTIATPGGPGVYVVFRLENVDNSGGTTPFSFSLGNLYTEGTQSSATATASYDATTQLNVALAQNGLLQQPPPQPIKAGGGAGGLNNLITFIAPTTAPDGLSEASSTVYQLYYHRQPGDPGVVLVRTQDGSTTPSSAKGKATVKPNCQDVVGSN